jgi:hypothetical protein
MVSLKDRDSSPIAIAGVNATILSIIIALVTAYAIHDHSVTQKMEIEALEEAEKINQVLFAPSWYSPKSEEFSQPRTHSDRVHLFNYLFVLLSQLTYDPPLKMYDILRDPAERAEKAFRLMNIIGHSYPFPKAIEKKGSGWARIQPAEPLCFESLKAVRNWLEDLNELLKASRVLLFDIAFLNPPTQLLTSLVEKQRELLEGWGTSPLSPEKYIDPRFLLKDFCANFGKAAEIAESVSYHLNRVDRFRKGWRGKVLPVLVLLVAGFAFCSGVILPLVFRQTSRVFLLYIPIGIYVLIYIYQSFFGS